MLALETNNRHAFELVADAIGSITAYRETRDRSALEHALDQLRQARREDNRYLLAPYYMAVIEDLLGRSRDAADLLRDILAKTEVDRRDFINEMRFNLAVAQYHGYKHEYLADAAATLKDVLRDTSGFSDRLRLYRVRLHSYALLAQVHAMWSIPKKPEDALAEEEQVRIKREHERAVSEARRVLYSPMLVLLYLSDQARFREVRAIAHNALGAAVMYYTDFFEDTPTKLTKLRNGLEHLSVADRLFPRDWAIYCNVGSCHMRLGYWQSNAAEFDSARDYLTQVVEKLRPGYGFALYEIGRSYRIQARFDDALQFFNRALMVPAERREVSDRRLNREVTLAEEKSPAYP
jgi:tetratricopeptide (TPR) repeat protein